MIKNYSVEGMTCGHCSAAVQEEISEIPGTQGVEVDLEAGTVSVTGEGFTDEDVVRAVENAGYTVNLED